LIKPSTSQSCNSQKLEQYPDDDVEEVNYGSSSPEEIYQHENNGDSDWDEDHFIYD